MVILAQAGQSMLVQANQSKDGVLSLLGNVIWFLFGGLISGLSWIMAGCLWCISIVGIPFGMQCFKIAKLALMPFGASIE